MDSADAAMTANGPTNTPDMISENFTAVRAREDEANYKLTAADFPTVVQWDEPDDELEKAIQKVADDNIITFVAHCYDEKSYSAQYKLAAPQPLTLDDLEADADQAGAAPPGRYNWITREMA